MLNRQLALLQQHAARRSSRRPPWSFCLPAPAQPPPRQQRAASGRAALSASSSSSSSSAQHAGSQPQPPHVSVLLEEVLEAFNHMPIRVFVDCTLGAGGHTAGMVEAHPELEVAAGIDVDPTAHAIAGARLAPLLAAHEQAAGSSAGQPGLVLHQLRGNYSEVQQLLASCPGGSLVGRADAMLMDLGVSSMQLDSPERGFSVMADGPIDMRMGPSAGASAEELVNCATEAELGAILRDYGEERSWKAVARRIASAREVAPIKTTQQLVSVIGQTQLRGSSTGRGGGGRQGARRLHPATRTFQALRIAVNDELRQLERALPAAISCLSPGGRLGVISFHSLEDRLVKHAFLAAAGRPTPAQEPQLHGPDGLRLLDVLAAAAQGSLVTRKPVTPGAHELAANPRSRSAKLRVFERAGRPAAAGGVAAASVWQRRGSRKQGRAQVDDSMQ